MEGKNPRCENTVVGRYPGKECWTLRIWKSQTRKRQDSCQASIQRLNVYAYVCVGR